MAPRNERDRTAAGRNNNRMLTWGLVAAVVVLALVFLLWPAETTDDATVDTTAPEAPAVTEEQGVPEEPAAPADDTPAVEEPATEPLAPAPQ